MVINLIKIRFSQIYREMANIGLFRAIVLLIILLPLLFVFLYTRLTVPNYNHIITGVALIVVLVIHRRRKDYHFLYKVSKFPAWNYYTEYLVFSIPLVILFLLTAQYFHVLIYISLLIAISFIVPTPKINKTYSSFIKYVPSGLFEWQGGIRKDPVTVILFYVIGLLGIYKVWFSAISVFLLMTLICSFYSENEPIKLLEAAELNATKFIKDKLIRHTQCLALFISPIFLLSFVHYEYWPYIVGSFFVIMNLQVSAILLKYAFYRPNGFSGTQQMFGTIILLVSVILPLAILVVILNFLLYHKAVRNLNTYLNAYN